VPPFSPILPSVARYLRQRRIPLQSYYFRVQVVIPVLLFREMPATHPYPGEIPPVACARTALISPSSCRQARKPFSCVVASSSHVRLLATPASWRHPCGLAGAVTWHGRAGPAAARQFPGVTHAGSIDRGDITLRTHGDHIAAEVFTKLYVAIA
jgi:hypothetical protein